MHLPDPMLVVERMNFARGCSNEIGRYEDPSFEGLLCFSI